MWHFASKLERRKTSSLRAMIGQVYAVESTLVSVQHSFVIPYIKCHVLCKVKQMILRGFSVIKHKKRRRNIY